MVPVTVRSPFPVSAWPRVWSWIEDFRARVCDDFAPKTLEAFVLGQIHPAPNVKSWAVYRGEELCGLVLFTLGPNGLTGETHALFRKDFWGKVTTQAALRQVYAEVFASGVHRIYGTPFRDNHAMIALARSVGFQKEGIFRETTKRGGEFVDQVMLGMTQGDFEQCRS
jgi:RimJ/RimL family protein N-acetyltransferase